MLEVESPPTTVRGAIVAAQKALANVRPEYQLVFACAALECALDLLNASDREIGTFHDAEPFRLVLDPLPIEPTKLILLEAS